MSDYQTCRYVESVLRSGSAVSDRSHQHDFQDTLDEGVSIKLLVQERAGGAKDSLYFFTWRVGKKNGQRILRSIAPNPKATSHYFHEFYPTRSNSASLAEVKEYTLGKLDLEGRTLLEKIATEDVPKTYGITHSYDWMYHTLLLLLEEHHALPNASFAWKYFLELDTTLLTVSISSCFLRELPNFQMQN